MYLTTNGYFQLNYAYYQDSIIALRSLTPVESTRQPRADVICENRQAAPLNNVYSATTDWLRLTTGDERRREEATQQHEQDRKKDRTKDRAQQNKYAEQQSNIRGYRAKGRANV